MAWRAHHLFDSRRQFLNRVEDGLAELIRLPEPVAGGKSEGEICEGVSPLIELDVDCPNAEEC